MTNSILLKTKGENHLDAEMISMRFIDSETKNRAYINAFGASLMMRYLEENGIKTSQARNIHTITKVLERMDISDIMLDNIHIDVRVVFDEKQIFIPKSHFEYGIEPDVYAVAKLDKDFKHIEFLGYIEPENIDKSKRNSDYYFVSLEELSPAEEFVEFVKGFETDKNESLSPEELDQYESLSMRLADHDISQRDFEKFVKQLTLSSELREKIIEFDHFETVSYDIASNLGRQTTLTVDGQDLTTDFIENQDYHVEEIAVNGEEVVKEADILEVLDDLGDPNGEDMLEDSEQNESAQDESESPEEQESPQEDEEKTDLQEIENVVEEIPSNDVYNPQESDFGISASDIVKTAGTAAAGMTIGAAAAELASGAGVTQEAMELAGMAGEILPQVTSEEPLQELEPVMDLAREPVLDMEAPVLETPETDTAELAAPELEVQDVSAQLEEEISLPQDVEDTIELPQVTQDFAPIDAVDENVTLDEMPVEPEFTETQDYSQESDIEQMEDLVDLNNSEEFHNEDFVQNEVENLEELEPVEDSNTYQEPQQEFSEEISDTNASDESEEELTEIIQPGDEVETEVSDNIFDEFDIEEAPEESPSELSDNVENFVEQEQDNDANLEEFTNIENNEEGEEEMQNTNYPNAANDPDTIDFSAFEQMDDSQEITIDEPIEPQQPVFSDEPVIENSTAISDSQMNVGEIPIDINGVSVGEIPESEQLEEIYDAGPQMAGESLLQDSQGLTSSGAIPKPSVKAGLAGLLVLLALVGIVGFGIFKFTQKPQEEVPPAIANTAPAPVQEEESYSPAQSESAPPVVTAQTPSSAPAKQISGDAFISISKVSWEVPEYVTYNQGFRDYFQSAGKSLKLALSSDLLLATEYPYNTQVNVSLDFAKDGSLRAAKIISPSGSTQVDNIVLQTVNQTLNVLKAPQSLGNDENTTAILKIYF